MFSIFSKASYVSIVRCSQRCRTKYYIYVNTITIYQRTVNIYIYTNQHHSIMGSFNGYKFPDWHGAFLNCVDPPRKEKKRTSPSNLEVPCDRNACWMSGIGVSWLRMKQAEKDLEFSQTWSTHDMFHFDNKIKSSNPGISTSTNAFSTSASKADIWTGNSWTGNVPTMPLLGSLIWMVKTFSGMPGF